MNDFNVLLFNTIVKMTYNDEIARIMMKNSVNKHSNADFLKKEYLSELMSDNFIFDKSLISLFVSARTEDYMLNNKIILNNKKVFVDKNSVSFLSDNLYKVMNDTLSDVRFSNENCYDFNIIVSKNLHENRKEKQNQHAMKR